MPPVEPRAIVPRRAIRPTERPAGPDPVEEAEERLRALLAEASALDGEVEALSVALADFARRYELAFAEPFASVAGAERLVRRLQRLEEEVARLAERVEQPPAPAARSRGRRAKRSGVRGAAPPFAWHAFEEEPAAPAEPEEAPPPAAPEPPPELADEAASVKRLYRRLARILHPDLARDDAERARLGDLMARVNAAYARGDRTALEVMAEKVGAGQPMGDLAPEERLAHLARRATTLENVAASLRAERARLRRSDTARLRDAAEARAAGGGDWFAETAASLAEEERGAAADALARLDRLARAARGLDRARRKAMEEIAKRGPTGARRAFDPLAESALVRRGAQLLERQRATGAARELARRLEEEVAERPWEVALAILALFLEEAVRPPPSVESGAGLAERWELLRASWDGAPDLPRALARLPRHLELGLRGGRGGVAAGLQLAAPELAAGVRIALRRPSVAAIGRGVLAALGPWVRCRRCRREVVALHLLRTRGLDELNGLACPRCGSIARSYWRYGEPEGLEALAAHALDLGLAAEQPLSLAGTAVGFQMLPAERDALTAAGLRARFVELYLRPYEVELPPGALAIVAGRRALTGRERIAGRRVSLVPSAGSGTTAEGLLELLRGRIAGRFKG